MQKTYFVVKYMIHDATITNKKSKKKEENDNFTSALYVIHNEYNRIN